MNIQGTDSKVQYPMDITKKKAGMGRWCVGQRRTDGVRALGWAQTCFESEAASFAIRGLEEGFVFVCVVFPKFQLCIERRPAFVCGLMCDED